MHVEQIVCIRLIVERQVFVVMSFVTKDAGHVQSMIVHSIVTDALRIPVKVRQTVRQIMTERGIMYAETTNSFR